MHEHAAASSLSHAGVEIRTEPNYTLILERGPEGWRATGDRSVRLGTPGLTFGEWDWRDGRLNLATDRYGMIPLFFASEADRFVLSTSMFEMLHAGVSADLDDVAIAVHLRLGHAVGDDTPFRAIRRVPAGVECRWTDDGPRLSGGPFLTAANGLGRTQLIDAYIELFRDTIRRHPPTGRLFLPLSGGRDSRHILFELLAAGHRPEAVVTARHYPPLSNADATVAALLAGRLGLRHDILTQPRDRAAAELRKNLMTQFCSPTMHAWFLPVADFMAEHATCSYDGIAGDVLSMGQHLKPEAVRLYREERFEEHAATLFEVGEPFLGRSLSKAAGSRFGRRAAIDRVVAELRRHIDAANPVRSFRFWNRTRRLNAPVPFGLFRRTQILAPYLHQPLFDLLAGISPEALMANEGHLHTEVILRGYPEYADIPFEPSDQPRADDNAYYRSYARGSLSRLLRAGTRTPLRPAYLVPRLMRCMVDPSYKPSVHWLAPIPLYLTQLEALARRNH